MFYVWVSKGLIFGYYEIQTFSQKAQIQNSEPQPFNNS